MRASIDTKFKTLNDVMKEFDPKEDDYVDNDKKMIDELEAKIMDKIQAKLDSIEGGKPTEQEHEEVEESNENEEQGEEENGDN